MVRENKINKGVMMDIRMGQCLCLKSVNGQTLSLKWDCYGSRSGTQNNISQGKFQRRNFIVFECGWLFTKVKKGRKFGRYKNSRSQKKKSPLVVNSCGCQLHMLISPVINFNYNFSYSSVCLFFLPPPPERRRTNLSIRMGRNMVQTIKSTVQTQQEPIL